jgi:hypothetical protein
MVENQATKTKERERNSGEITWELLKSTSKE